MSNTDAELLTGTTWASIGANGIGVMLEKPSLPYWRRLFEIILEEDGRAASYIRNAYPVSAVAASICADEPEPCKRIIASVTHSSVGLDRQREG